MKRIDPLWRIVIALVLVFALAPVVALSVPTQAQAPPDTYIDPIPTYVYDVDEITGTSVCSALTTMDAVKVQIKYEEGNTTYYWDGGTWVADIEKWIDASIGASPAVPNHWDWSYDTSGISWQNGDTYDIQAKALDDLVQSDGSPAQESFTCDQTTPTTGVDAIADPYPGTATTTLDEITGTATDTTPGKIDAVWVSINRSDGAYPASTIDPQ